MSLIVKTTFGRKNERSIEVEVDAPVDINGWIDRIGPDGVLNILNTHAVEEISAESKRIMARDPDLTEAEAQTHFDTLFQFNKDMVRLEKAARLKAELAALGAV